MYFYVENIKDEPIDLVSNQRIFRDHLVLKKMFVSIILSNFN